ncbi:hypothetical protein COCVIDRAFT_111033, partial [Bipolaris victoriae FI3]
LLRSDPSSYLDVHDSISSPAAPSDSSLTRVIHTQLIPANENHTLLNLSLSFPSTDTTCAYHRRLCFLVSPKRPRCYLTTSLLGNFFVSFPTPLQTILSLSSTFHSHLKV